MGTKIEQGSSVFFTAAGERRQAAADLHQLTSEPFATLQRRLSQVQDLRELSEEVRLSLAECEKAVAALSIELEKASPIVDPLAH